MEKDFQKELEAIIVTGQVLQEELLSKHTTFKIGGPAEYFVTPGTKEELIQLVQLCQNKQIPYYILGNGSNLLVGDKGYRGVMIHLFGTLNEIFMEKDTKQGVIVVSAGAGIMLSKLAMEVARAGYTGFEFAAGIPGTLGGAITMNAGAYGGEIKDCIQSVTIITPKGEVKTLTKDELELGYRTSKIQKSGYIVLEAKFEFKEGDTKEILSKVNELNRKRREKQPLEYPSAGSTFKRPEGYFAGKLIQDAGLRGYRVGDVMVSEKHCGFVVNVGNGTAKQVMELVKHVDEVVYEQFEVHLEPEIRMVGEF